MPGSAPAADAVALENETVSGAIRTDFILSAEIMAISLAGIATQSIVMQTLVLLAVGLFVTDRVWRCKRKRR
jgi:predicted DNA repair protein MutK